MSEKEEEKYPLICDDGPSSIANATDASNITSKANPDDPASRPASKGRINDRFLKSLVRNAEGHNSALLRKERAERLGLRKHPLVDKIKEIERKKLERVRSDRRRSRSPSSRAHNETVTSKVRRLEGHRDKVDGQTERPKVRGRGAIASSQPIDEFGKAKPVNVKPRQSAEKQKDDEPRSAGTQATVDTAIEVTNRRKRPIPPWSTDELLDATADSWPFVKSNNVVIEEDEQGKWKCGAGYL